MWAQLTTPPPSAQAASRRYALLGLSNLNFQTLAPSSKQLLAFLKSPFSSCKDVIIQSKKKIINVANTHISCHNKQILDLKNLNLNLSFKYISMQQNI